jgi:hypothetical protein
MKPGGKVSEAIGLGVFALAAGNIAIFTVQSFKATYKRPPLSLWQTGAGEKPGKNSGTPNGEKKKKKESLLEKGGKAALKLIPGGSIIEGAL